MSKPENSVLVTHTLDAETIQQMREAEFQIFSGSPEGIVKKMTAIEALLPQCPLLQNIYVLPTEPPENKPTFENAIRDWCNRCGFRLTTEMLKGMPAVVLVRDVS
ncbi:MAG TPA: hypothetical protein VKT71_12270 [Candidatus Acidoferrales bacterium]|nr:hypothetical protein [Candidatus Acidoferrales bacterium]